MYELGLLYFIRRQESFEGLDLAIDYFSKAVKLGHDVCMVRLLRIYRDFSYNENKYVDLLKRFVEKGSSESMVTLADYYVCSGQMDKANDLYQKATALDDPYVDISIKRYKETGEPLEGCRK